MSHFLVIFDRKKRSDPQIEQIEDAREAQQRLFDLESELQSDPDRDVVLLVAERQEDLLRTHGHYFKSMEEIIAVGSGAFAA